MLRGERTRIRALEMSDLDNCYTWINDEEVIRFLSMRFPASRKQEETWLERAVKGEDPGERNYAIEIASSGPDDGYPGSQRPEHIGNIGLMSIDWVSGTAELGIFIGKKEYWGKGYGQDAIRTLLRFAFSQLRLRKVFLRVMGSNVRAQKCYSKVGFKEVGRLKNHFLKNGIFEDEVFMEMFAEDLK